MKLLKLLWDGWKKVGHAMGVVWTFVFMTIFYFLVVGPASFVALLLRKDLLRTWTPERSYYRPHEKQEESLERYQHLF